MTDKKKSCFVISPIGTSGTPERKRADLVLKHILKASLEPLGYEVIRADEISQPGSITLQVLERVLQSELVVADLTGHNPNVFYELAVRHASEKPVIHVIQSGQKIPFDIADLRAIFIDTDLEGAERSRNDLAAQVKQIEAGHLGETPVKLAGVLKHLDAGKSEDKIILKQLLDGMTELRSDLRLVLERNQSVLSKGIEEVRDILVGPRVSVSYAKDDDKKTMSERDLKDLISRTLSRAGVNDGKTRVEAFREVLPILASSAIDLTSDQLIAEVIVESTVLEWLHKRTVKRPKSDQPADNS